ncbi:MAG: hypothetical protein V4664_02105 [Patescibacteria group bacterium]
MKIPKILAVFLDGPIISPSEMSHHSAVYNPRSKGRRATSGAFCFLRQIVANRCFNRVLLIGAKGKEPYDRRWVETSDILRLSGMKPADLRFYRVGTISADLHRIGVTHALLTREDIADKLPVVGTLYIMSTKQPSKTRRCHQAVHRVENGWAGIAKTLL